MPKFIISLLDFILVVPFRPHQIALKYLIVSQIWDTSDSDFRCGE